MGEGIDSTSIYRDNRGRLLPGHPSTFKQHKPGHNAGRPKTMRREVKDALKIAEDAMPDIITKMTHMAKGGNIQAATYLADRIYGKASQPIVGERGKPIIIHVVYDEELLRDAERR